MNLTDHQFNNTHAEYKLIKELLLEIEGHPELDNNWEPGRMDWWRYNSHSQKDVEFFQANAHYWKTDKDKVVGLFITENGRDDFFIVMHPDFLDLFHPILKWGLDVWAKGKKQISTEVFTFAEQKIEKLTAAGFYEDGPIENLRTYTLEGYDFSYDLKPGFKLLTCAEYDNVESRVQLVQNAFGNPNFSAARLLALQDSPAYRPELDLVIVSPEGQAVGYCIGWIEESNPKSGYIEPMGVHSEFRQNKFGKILAKECFKRLASLGAETAWIASRAEPDISNFLYDSLKPTSIKRSFKYSLNLEG